MRADAAGLGRGRWSLLRGRGWFNWRGRPPRTLLVGRPPPAGEPNVRIWAARTGGLRGLFSVHCWLVYRAHGGEAVRWDVVGRRARTGKRGVQTGVTSPRESWAQNPGRLVLDLRGERAARAIPEIEAAIARYPDLRKYCGWPGPNCNSFIAYLAREVPALHTELPAHAVGKDFLPGRAVVGQAPSGTGWQVSLLGVLGLLWARTEGLEICLFGVVVGLDLRRAAVKLPCAGRVPLCIGASRQVLAGLARHAVVPGRRPSIG